MLKKHFLEDLGITRKDFLMVFILLFNTLSWYFMTQRIIDGILKDLSTTYLQTLIIWGAHNAAIIGSSIAGSILSDKVGRLRFLYLWIILGAVTSSTPALLTNLTMMQASSISFFLGISFGLGMPSCLAYFADCTVFENRGRMGGIIFLATNLSGPLVVMLFKVDLAMNSIISVTWRGLGLIMLFLLKPSEKIAVEKKERVSFTLILRNKPFLLYLVPWLMFCLVDGFEVIIFKQVFEPEFFDFLSMTEPIIGTLFAFIGGLLCDWIGRKRVVIYGFIALGLAYAVLGIAPTMLISRYFYCIIDGIAWGVFLVAFILVLWGDLSPSGSIRQRYYVIGSIPFYFARFIRLLSAPYVLIPAYAAFSVASFFLFVAVLPLMYAPETLPEKKIELRRLRKYVEKAKKIREKFVERGAEG